MGIFRARNIFIALSALGAIWLGWLVANEYALSYASQHYLANGVVRIELPGGRKFDIPERYMYWEGYVKHGRWPKPKEGRVKVESFNFDALLPDLRPYRAEDDEKWQELGYGDKLHVYVHRKDFDATSWRHVYESELDSVERGYAKRLDNENGLAKFLNLSGKEGDLKPYDVTYFTEDFRLKINCSYPGTVIAGMQLRLHRWRSPQLYRICFFPEIHAELDDDTQQSVAAHCAIRARWEF
ncbi:hypothetical protein [Sinorhizobium prairiense]|uniref:hypothetical protein n=1 Tax=unclassified Sinorhizobium TaxID=2613772 RepID=UPI0023D8B64A|nr:MULTISPECIES: hypothetical protein [unclassified Sinorhizobium]WEJ11164.1 hypothetical protein N0Q90_08705 [Sinorhizobium sp. M103]WEJ14236.1 hypothetical protein N0Q91_11615 [Sinorhizobium sp. K101]WEJ38148.1 hypothetical protein N0R80_08675 [Sinorhizobium sp. C101]